MTTGFESHLRGTLAGQLTDGEARFCSAIRKATGDVLESRVHFLRFIAAVKQDLDTLVAHGLDADAAAAVGWAMESLPTTGSNAAPSQAEVTFLKDVDGLVSFVSRNGLDFNVILNVLAHDVGEIIGHGLSLEQALADHVRPKASGWATRNAATVGEADE